MATMGTHTTERRHFADRRADSSRGLSAVDWAAMVILIVGGINWGLVGLMNFDLVAALFGEMTGAARIVYALVGLSALYAVYLLTKLAGEQRTT